MSRLSDEDNAALVGCPWLCKTLHGEVHLMRFAPNNGNLLFLITTLEAVYLECLTPSLMLRRADGCDMKGKDAFGRKGLSRTQQMEAVAEGLERTFRPGQAWDDLTLEDGLADNDYSRVLNFRSDDFLWTCKLDKLPGDEALLVLKDHLVAPLIGVLAACAQSMGDIEAMTRRIDDTAFAGHRKLGMLVESTMQTPIFQSSMQRWNQRQVQGPKVKKEDLVLLRATVDRDEPPVAECSRSHSARSSPPPVVALQQRASTPLPSPSASESARNKTRDLNPDEPGDASDAGGSQASSVTIDEDEVDGAQPLKSSGRRSSRRELRATKDHPVNAIDQLAGPSLSAHSLKRSRSSSSSSPPPHTEPESSLSLDQQRVAELRQALRQTAAEVNNAASQTNTHQVTYRGRGRAKRGRSIW